MKTSFFLGAASAIVSIGAAQSRPTDSAPLPGIGSSPPKITPPPGLNDIQQGLFKRDYNRPAPPITILLAPDNTCGWISGSSAAPYLCQSGGACGLGLPQLTARGFLICFQAEKLDVMAHPWYVNCFEYSNYHASTDCGECHSRNVVKCVSSDRPFCNTYYFSGGGIVDFRCDSTRENVVIGVETTWTGQTGSRTYEKIILHVDPVDPYLDSASESTNSTAASPTTSGSSGGDSSKRESHKTSIGRLTTTSIATKALGSSGLGDHQPPDINMGRHNGETPIGAIVGGVVGGVASLLSLGAVVLMTFYLRRKKRRTAGTTEAPPSSRPLMQSTASPEMSIAQNQASSDSNPNDGSESLQTCSASVQQHQSGVCELQGQQRQEPSIHELPSQISHHHRGQIHELA
ncbi:hypothetical protein E4U58_000969 [Claviceps cyperi]|nr:hypothetical protein E4U58_000969 [Claviceps cyperi]